MSEKFKNENNDTIVHLLNGKNKDLPEPTRDFNVVEEHQIEEESPNNESVKEYAEKNLKEIIEIGTTALKSLASSTTIEEGRTIPDELLELVYTESPKVSNAISSMIRSLTTANHKLTTLGIESGKVPEGEGSEETDDGIETLKLSVNELQRQLKEQD